MAEWHLGKATTGRSETVSLIFNRFAVDSVGSNVAMQSRALSTSSHLLKEKNEVHDVLDSAGVVSFPPSSWYSAVVWI